MENKTKRRMTLWKRELMIFGLLFLALCFVYRMRMILFSSTQSSVPRFIGFDNYVNLFLNDDVFLLAIWNTARVYLIVWIMISAVLILIKQVLSTKINSVPAGAFDVIVYLLLFLALTISAVGFSQCFGLPSSAYPAHIITSRLQDYKESAVSSWFMYSLEALPVTYLLTFLTWAFEHVVIVIVKRIRKRAKQSGQDSD